MEQYVSAFRPYWHVSDAVVVARSGREKDLLT
jgi:hypothetical protein